MVWGNVEWFFGAWVASAVSESVVGWLANGGLVRLIRCSSCCVVLFVCLFWRLCWCCHCRVSDRLLHCVSRRRLLWERYVRWVLRVVAYRLQVVSFRLSCHSEWFSFVSCEPPFDQAMWKLSKCSFRCFRCYSFGPSRSVCATPRSLSNEHVQTQKMSHVSCPEPQSDCSVNYHGGGRHAILNDCFCDGSTSAGTRLAREKKVSEAE